MLEVMQREAALERSRLPGGKIGFENEDAQLSCVPLCDENIATNSLKCVETAR